MRADGGLSEVKFVKSDNEPGGFGGEFFEGRRKVLGRSV